jgi:hypothetical protein
MSYRISIRHGHMEYLQGGIITTLDEAVRIANLTFDRIYGAWKSAADKHIRRAPKPSVVIYEVERIIAEDTREPRTSTIPTQA